MGSCIARCPFLVLASLALAGPALAQEGGVDSGPRSVLDGVYTAAQAVSGKAIFGEVCAACHASSQFNGLVRIWAGRTVHDLFESIRTTMPYDGPGRLSAGEYADLVAYILTLNGLPPGDEPLAGDAGLKRIRIEVGGERGS